VAALFGCGGSHSAQAEFEEFSDLAEFIVEHITEQSAELTEFQELHHQVIRDRLTGVSEVSDYDFDRYNFLCGVFGIRCATLTRSALPHVFRQHDAADRKPGIGHVRGRGAHPPPHIRIDRDKRITHQELPRARLGHVDVGDDEILAGRENRPARDETYFASRFMCVTFREAGFSPARSHEVTVPRIFRRAY
jgi:hypothetical protein